jgi:hypothetical protein
MTACGATDAFGQRLLSCASGPFTGPILKVAFGSKCAFDNASGDDRYLRNPAEDPRRFGSDSGHLVADPIGHEVRFCLLVALEILKSGEHRLLLVVRHLIEHAHVGAYGLLGLGPARTP